MRLRLYSAYHVGYCLALLRVRSIGVKYSHCGFQSPDSQVYSARIEMSPINYAGHRQVNRVFITPVTVLKQASSWSQSTAADLLAVCYASFLLTAALRSTLMFVQCGMCRFGNKFVYKEGVHTQKASSSLPLPTYTASSTSHQPSTWRWFLVS